MKISIGSDHRGFILKSNIIEKFDDIDWIDKGTNSTQRTDYPIYAKKVCQDLITKKAEKGILICGSGVGMAIAANRYPKIYAALCWSVEVVRAAVRDDKANILVLSSDFLDKELVYKMIDTWLKEEFKAGHYQKRLDMIDK